MTSIPEILTLQNDRIQLIVERHGARLTEQVSVKGNGGWIPAVRTNGFVTRLVGSAAPAAEEEILFDFDADPAWKTVEGDLPHAFTRSTRQEFGALGRTFIGTAELPDPLGAYDDGMTGVLESPPFQAIRRFLKLRVSGGGHVDQTYVALADAETGEEIARFYGGFSDRFHQETVDLEPHRHRTLVLRVVDRFQGGWGHINLDRVTLSDVDPAERVSPFAPGSPVEVASIARRETEGKASLEIVGTGPLGTVIRTLSLDERTMDAIRVHVALTPAEGVEIVSLEDRIGFAPERRADAGPLSGPLDAVWSPGIKARPDHLNPHWNFKSPAVLFQQGEVLAALVPELADAGEPRSGGELATCGERSRTNRQRRGPGPGRETLRRSPLALDLDVTGGEGPWLSCGLVPFEPQGHSYFIRVDTPLNASSGPLEFGYTLIASIAPPREGYRSIVRFLWDRIGRDELRRSPDLQKNIRRPELVLFDDWRHEAWERYAGEAYREFSLDGAPVGTLVSRRNVDGDWGHPQDDAWFNSWFQSLRTAYGWFLGGRRAGNSEQQRRATRILDLALKAPQRDGLFPSIYLLGDGQWVPGDGWAAYRENFHTFTGSWTAYWMLRWAEDLVPERKAEILAFCRPYGDFLVRHQLPSGCIPSWFHADGQPREEYREFNAETAGSALCLVTLAGLAGRPEYLEAGRRAMEFVTREVLPRQRWYDYETFRSCARKPYDFYDSWTAQYPQNNLSTIQAAMAYAALHRATGEAAFLSRGEAVLDYLLLTQQVWNHRLQDPKLVGGFTTQNTDAEWSDARQCYAADLLFDYYRLTGREEYLERAVAAARSTFAVAPWENWSHFGHENAPGAMTGIHWGTGSAMTSVERVADEMGDAYVHAGRGHGVGFNACTVTNVRVEDDRIRFDLATDPAWTSGPLQLRIDGADPERTYAIVVNGRAFEGVSGAALEKGTWPLPLPAGS